MSERFDLLVIGGGINGAGIARDAAGRGLSVALVEKDDLASHTSSASTKLVHGGLRYLEHYEFRLVAESLREREVLLANAPHIIWPLRFVLPHEPGMRPKWMLRAGLFLYDRLGGRKTLPGSHKVDLRDPPHRAILQDHLTSGFEYSDCWVEDSRLVVLTAMDAEERGAKVWMRTECIALERKADHWVATLSDPDGERVVEAKAVVNAAGPFVDKVAKSALGEGTPAHLRLVKGSHIIVPRAYSGDHAYIFQQADDRIVFAIPYERDFTLIGTTDLLYEGDLDHVEIAAEEREYLREAATRYLRSGITEEDIVHTYSGVRPLYEDNAASNSTVTRDYVFEIDADGGAPILSVYGGKITTYRKLAEHALEKLADHAEIPSQGWTAHAPLPGGDIEKGDFARFLWKASDRFSWVPPEMLLRLCRAYGTRIDRVLSDAHSLDELGTHLGGDLYEAELRYLVDCEYARSAEDVLWRRSKLGLHLSDETQESVREWFSSRS
ncbi:glycerol-3-phosphate dehydrogenase [Qipengyuania nanhaisediminis]|uniref:Glycerol-3-phosphate dehydrogenase n=1 Tax=Qipengyuania nanhaisediminis TaxID=604088 RepID=A0A1I5KM29_9SPHN|nr:glycerol-3-phosphate dehydrogenase [Qipengyuania nanhaisediminis]SFO86065.1 homodimeric glycerol 3-phosphate dehydrogenase (quinone) [Qipengyuania nanhaisediminis]